MILNDDLIHIKNENTEYLSYKKLNDLGVINAFSLKGLNFRNRKGIEEDYQTLLEALGIEYSKLVKPLAKHTKNVLIVEQKVNKDTADINLDYLNEIDGIITSRKDIAIATTSADCLCIILYDPLKKVLANVHSGWRGTFQKIIQEAIIKMKKIYECDAKDIFAFLMPAIRQCHFEVETDVMAQCKDIFGYTNRISEIIKVGRNIDGVQKYNIDNILLNRIMLEDEGVLKEHIYDSDLCTVCNNDKMHSRRADGENFGISTTIAMRLL